MSSNYTSYNDRRHAKMTQFVLLMGWQGKNWLRFCAKEKVEHSMPQKNIRLIRRKNAYTQETDQTHPIPFPALIIRVRNFITSIMFQQVILFK